MRRQDADREAAPADPQIEHPDPPAWSTDVLAGAVPLASSRAAAWSSTRSAPYLPGDDVRTIDWNVTARTGEPYVKRFVEERELTVMLLVDAQRVRPVRHARERLKRELAAELCALLALAARSATTTRSGCSCSPTGSSASCRREGQNHVLRVIREMLRFEPRAARHRPRARRSTICTGSAGGARSVFLLSDFLASGYERSLRLARRRHDVIPICIADRREADLPNVGLLSLRDLETGRRALVDTGSAAVRRQYRERREAAALARQRLFRSLGVDPIEVQTDQSYIQPLMRFFRQREQRLRAGR